MQNPFGVTKPAEVSFGFGNDGRKVASGGLRRRPGSGKACAYFMASSPGGTMSSPC